MTNNQLPISNLQSPLVVLISGHGSNLQAILDACASGELPATVAAVISDKPEAYGLERARRANVPAIARPKLKAHDRRDYDSELADLVASFQPDWIVLAGWMRLLTSAFLDRFPNRVVNLHPALPGAFPGARAIERAFDAYRRGQIQHTGVMVHLVPDEGVDSGPVLAQEAIPIYPDDTLETLEARVHSVEHRLLVDTLKTLCIKRMRTTNVNAKGVV
jgi:formyltetrahydrofolate-dependent phosphoribosylglycinamide formyltransferase